MNRVGSEGNNRSGRAHFIVTALLFIALLPLSPSIASATAPAISTSTEIENGAESPPVILDGVGFANDNDKFDFIVDVGTTSLEYDSVAFVSDTRMRFNFHGTAKTGTITIQANSTAFSPAATDASNTVEIVVPVPFIPQTITFTIPTTMTVKDPDQIPKAKSTSGLPVVLTSNTPSSCTIDFLKIHAVAAGTCSITATVNGNVIYSQALPVTRSFIVLAIKSVTPTEPQSMVLHETNLASLSYDPLHAADDEFSAVVESASAIHDGHSLVKLVIAPGATKAPAVFFISSFSTDEETLAGYFVARIKAIASDGSAIAILKKVTEISIPAGAVGATPSWSFDGLSWYKLKKLATKSLPSDAHAGFFSEEDGRIAILTDYLMLFGYRKDQVQLSLTSAARSIVSGAQTQILAKGGSGLGAVSFITRTPDNCSVSVGGVVTGTLAGECLVFARKSAIGVYADAKSSAVSVTIKPSAKVVVNSSVVESSSDLCHEMSYAVNKSSTVVSVNLCDHDARATATLEVGTKSKTGKWSYVAVKKQVLDGSGMTIFTVNSTVKAGQIIRVTVNGKVRISATI